MTTTTTASDLTELLLRDIFVRLSPADLLRAALACRRWRRAAVLALPQVPPVRAYFFHRKYPPWFHFDIENPSALVQQDAEPNFLPLPFNDASSSARRLSLNLTKHDRRTFCIKDVHLGLVLLLPRSFPWSGSQFPSILVVDPASRRQVQFQPHDALPEGEWFFVGAAILARAHPNRLTFEAICLVVCGDRLRAWVASVVNDNFDSWRSSALPSTQGVVIDFPPRWFDSCCVHAAGNIYWHINDSSRVLHLNPLTLEFSFMSAPDALDTLFGFTKYRVGETPEDGRLCIVSILDDGSLQIWVRGGEPRWSDRGWSLQREILLSSLLDAVPGLPKDNVIRMRYIKLDGIDFARTGRVFINIQGVHHYYDLKTGQLERSLEADHIFAYMMPWPPEFLAAPSPQQTEFLVVDQ